MRQPVIALSTGVVLAVLVISSTVALTLLLLADKWQFLIAQEMVPSNFRAVPLVVAILNPLSVTCLLRSSKTMVETVPERTVSSMTFFPFDQRREPS